MSPKPRPLYTSGPLRWRIPVGRHRHAGRIRVGALLIALATAAVVLAVGDAITDTELNSDERFEEFVLPGEVGEPVSAGNLWVTVLGARAAARIGGEPGEELDTGGVWVVVRLRAMALEESMWIGYAAVRAGGRTWSPTVRIQQPLIDGYRLDPGIPVEAEVAFEVPREVATNLTVRIGRPNAELRLHPIAEVALPVDAAMVADGLAEPEPIVLDRPEIVIADPPVLVGVPEPGDE